MSDERTHHVTVRLAREYEFTAEFEDLPGSPAILFDEPEPLGGNRAPNAATVLSAAVGDCLATSLAFCLRKARIGVDHLTARVTTHVVRNEKDRLRIGGIDVVLEPGISDADQERVGRCESLFEDFCTVTQSIRAGIPVNVSVTRHHAALARQAGS